MLIGRRLKLSIPVWGRARASVHDNSFVRREHKSSDSSNATWGSDKPNLHFTFIQCSLNETSAIECFCTSPCLIFKLSLSLLYHRRLETAASLKLLNVESVWISNEKLNTLNNWIYLLNAHTLFLLIVHCEIFHSILLPPREMANASSNTLLRLSNNKWIYIYLVVF